MGSLILANTGSRPTHLFELFPKVGPTTLALPRSRGPQVGRSVGPQTLLHLAFRRERSAASPRGARGTGVRERQRAGPRQDTRSPAEGRRVRGAASPWESDRVLPTRGARELTSASRHVPRRAD